MLVAPVLRYRKKAEGSYFSSCERDDQGHCLPKGEGGKPKEPSSTVKVAKRILEMEPSAQAFMDDLETGRIGGHAANEIGNALTLENVTVLYDKADDRLVGALAFRRDFDMAEIVHFGSLKKGVGRKLIEELMRKFDEIKAVNVTEEALGFYEKLGFVWLNEDKEDMVWSKPEEEKRSGPVNPTIKSFTIWPAEISEDLFVPPVDPDDVNPLIAAVDPEPIPAHKKGCLLIPVPDLLRKQIVDWTIENVADFHLAGDGRELSPHVTCFLPGQELQGRVIGGSKVNYSGKAVKLRTVSGMALSVTPNHPVMTLNGLVPAGDLSKGQHLIKYIGKGDETSIPHDYEQNAPSLVEKVFETLAVRSGKSFLAEDISVFDFHGDAEFFEGDVEIVGTDGFLRRSFYSPKMKSIKQHSFGRCNLRGEQQFTRFRRSLPLLNRNESSSISNTDSLSMNTAFIVSPLRKSNFESVRLPSKMLRSFSRSNYSLPIISKCNTALLKAGGDNASTYVQTTSYVPGGFSGFVTPDHFIDLGRSKINSDPLVDPICFGPAAELNTPFLKNHLNGDSTNTVFAGQLLDTFAGKIVIDEIIDIEIFHYDGSVYDFESPLGYILINGIVVSNCLYGFPLDFSEEQLDELKGMLIRYGPFPIRLGGLGAFRGGKDGDVLFVEVESPELMDLNAAVASAFGVESDYEYHPHLTLAYLQPQAVDLYLEESPPFIGIKSFPYQQKGEGTCKPGERADLTGCTPASGGTGKKPGPVNPTIPASSESESDVGPQPKTEEAATEQQQAFIADAVNMAKSEWASRCIGMYKQKMENWNEALSKMHKSVVKLSEKLQRMSKAHDKECSKLDKLMSAAPIGQPMSDEVKAQAEKVDAALNKYLKFRRGVYDAAWGELKKELKENHDPTLVKVKLKTDGLNGSQSEAVAFVEQRLSGFVSEFLKDRIDETIVRPIPPDQEQRAHFKGRRHGNTDESVMLDAYSKENVVAHEIGHALETHTKVHSLAVGFLYSRVGTEEAKPMGSNYKPWEVGRDDNFHGAFGTSARYVGKHYISNDTEVISMGLEKLMDDPIHFSITDPEYFKFIVGVVGGALL